MVQVSHSNHQTSQESWLPSMNLSAFCPVPISCPSSWADKGSWPKRVPHSCWLWMTFSSAILERSDCWCISVYMLAFQEEWVFGDFMMSDTCYCEGLNQVPWICMENRKLNVILHLKFCLHGMMCNILTMRIMIRFEQNTSQILTNVYPAVIISGLLQNVDHLCTYRYQKCARDWSVDPTLTPADLNWPVFHACCL